MEIIRKEKQVDNFIHSEVNIDSSVTGIIRYGRIANTWPLKMKTYSIMCDKCSNKEHCDYLKKGDIQNCLKRSMISNYCGDWNDYLANCNGWFQDL